MFWKLFSLLGVTLAFTALVLWVYWPSNRERLERFGHIPMNDDSASADTGTNGESNA